MSRKFILGLLILGFSFAIQLSAQNLNGSFKEANEKSNAKFLIHKAPAPLFRDPPYDGAADPTVIWNAAKKEWLIFYTQRRASLDMPGVAYCYGTAIGIAASHDYGETWHYKGTANLPQPDSGLNTFWAPQVFYNHDDKMYHMIVSYIKGVHENWGGLSHVVHYVSSDLAHWQRSGGDIVTDGIDASVFQLKDNSWKMWYKDNKTSTTWSATTKDFVHWKFGDSAEVKNRIHEAPVVFYWKNSFWMITDPCFDGYTGLDVFRSNDAAHWQYNSTILNTPGIRPDDRDQGRHADVKIINGKAFIFYFTHPGRVYPKKGDEDADNNRWRYRRSSLQVAELGYSNGKITCDRDKYALVHPPAAIEIPE